MSDANVWAQVLEQLRTELDPEEFRRWLSSSTYASDSGDQISVWVTSAADGRHLSLNYHQQIQRALVSLGRTETLVRFLATGFTGDDEDRVE